MHQRLWDPQDSDSLLLQQRYIETFNAVVASAEQLMYRSLAWSNVEAMKLAVTLRPVSYTHLTLPTILLV